MCSKNMESIIKHRDLILLAEIGALIHDLGKLSEEFVGHSSVEKEPEKFPHNKIFDPNYMPKSLMDIIDKIEVDDLFQSKKKIKILRELIENHHGRNRKSNLLKILKAPGCDAADSGVDKGTPGRKQSKDNTFISTAFGYEKRPINLSQLKSFRDEFCDVLEKELSKIKNAKDGVLDWKEIRANIFKSAEQTFSKALGETRRASNDVTLWDHSYSVASLYKAALAKILIDNELTGPQDLKWRILSINFDKLKFMGSSYNIPDTLRRKELLEGIEEKIKNFIEVEFPVGNEIYRDETGIYFGIPNPKDNSKQEELKNIFTEEVIRLFQDVIDGEILPEINISKDSRPLTILGNAIGKGKNQPPVSQVAIPKWKDKWNKDNLNKTALLDEGLCKIVGCKYYDNNTCKKHKINVEVCPICGKRPKCEKQNLCKICFGRRDGRAVEWFGEPEKTIWLDEVSDLNNRVAVITARFDLSKWLNGEYLNTLFSQWFDDVNGREYKDDTNNKYTFNLDMSEPYYSLVGKLKALLSNQQEKRPEFKAISEAYHDQSTKDFVGAIVKERDHLGIVQNNDVTEDQLALFLFKKHPSPARLRRIWKTTNYFFDSYINEIFKQKENYLIDIKDEKNGDKLKERRFSRIRITIEEDSEEKRVISGSYKGSILDTSISDLILYWNKEKGEFISICNLQSYPNIEPETLSGKKLKIKSETSDREQSLTIKEAIVDATKYLPFVKLFTSPDKFQVIVPTSSALSIAKKIKEKYETEFSKVQNRLPLHIGVVYIPKKHPIYTALDTSERMFKEAKKIENLEIIETSNNVDADADGECISKKITLKNNTGTTTIINVSIKTGDKNIFDDYYPFYILNKELNEGRNIEERKTYFETYIKDEENKNLKKVDLLHVTDLQKGDRIDYAPSYFDFQFLETSTRRFEIKLDKDINKRKHDILGEKSPRPYYLENLDNFTKLWEILNDKNYKITSSQINNLNALLTSKIHDWCIGNSKLNMPEFEDLVEDSIVNILRINKEDYNFKFIKDAILSGLFFDVIELYTKIMKEKIGGK